VFSIASLLLLIGLTAGLLAGLLGIGGGLVIVPAVAALLATSGLDDGVAVGAALGAWLATLVSGDELARIFAVIAGLIGLRMLLAGSPTPGDRTPSPRLWWLAGPVIGTASALVGIGGGSFNVPYLVRNGYGMVQAVANAAACGWPIALAGTVTFALVAPESAALEWTIGHVWMPGVLLVGLGGLVAAPAGVALAHRLPARRLRRIFGVVLILVALRMAW
jgi:uncharacterized membrane protein YfcA